MNNRRGLVGALALGAAGTLVLAACGSSSSSSSPSTTTPSASESPAASASESPNASPSQVATAYDAAQTAIVNPSDKEGGTLKFAASADCDSWDPQRTYYAWCWDMQRLTSRTLTAFKSVPGPEGASVVPDLAEGPGEANADKTEWTYKIKSGIKFSDGTPVTSKDFKYSLQRLFATDVINGGPSSYYLCLLSTCAADGTPAYKGPYADPTGDLKSVTTPDDNTLVLKLVKAFGGVDYLMSQPITAPIPKAKDTKGDYGKKPLSTGPFVISEYSPGKSLTFTRNTNWDQATDDVRKPKADKISLQIIEDTAVSDAKVLSGEIDLQADGGLQPEAKTKVFTDEKLKVNADNPVDGFIRYFAVMQTVAPLDNKACRDAVFLALNKAELLQIRGGKLGGAIANTMTPPNIPGHDPAYNPYPTGADNTGDLEGAKAKLTECGQPSGFTVNMTYVNQGLGGKTFASVQGALKRVGITVNSLPGDAASYYSTWIGSPKNIVDKKIGIAVAGWGADFPTPYGFWNSIANGKLILPEGNSNYPSINTEAVNSAIDAVAAETDPTKLQPLGATLDAAVMDTATYLPFLFGRSFWYRNPRLTNVYINSGLGNFYDYVQIGTSDGK